MGKNQGKNAKGQHLPLAYPFNWQGIDPFHYPRDKNGIPRVFIDKKWGLRYNPITTAQYGLHNLSRYDSHRDSKFLTLAMQQADWLIRNVRPWHDSMLAWVYDYDLDFYGPKAPWISAMAQGEAISLLLRIHQIEPNSQIPEITRKAVRAFFSPVHEGGVVSAFPDGFPIFEEYPTSPPSRVLNGHIFSLFGLHDFAVFWEDEEVFSRFHRAVDGLERNLHRYDTGYWNLYDLHPTHRLAAPMYIHVHVQLLTILSQITGRAYFRNVAEKWQKYLASPVCRGRWLLGKCREKVRLRISNPASNRCRDDEV